MLTELFSASTGQTAEQIYLLPGAGSNRRYYRLSNRYITLIGVAGNVLAENEAFLYLSRHFKEQNLPVPAIHAVSPDKMHYLVDDLGDTALFDLIRVGRESGVWTDEEISALDKTIKMLPLLQWKGAEGLDFSKCYPIPQMDRRSIMWDLNYFKYCFLKSTGLNVDEPKLEDDFQKLCDMLLENDTATFMFRDFQSRNVMVDCDGEPHFIDYQGGRRGPYQYDVVSFLWQAKARIPDELKEHLIDSYIEASKPFKLIEPSTFRKELRLFALFRTLQVLGAYGFRGYFEQKRHFLQSIPDAISNLRGIILDNKFGLDYLSDLLITLTEQPQFQGTDKANATGELTVKVASFGFKKSGIPSDPTGNGGGFVFDCRALNNPGRYERFRHLTGLDKEVIDFLEADGEILTFLDHAYSLVDTSVESYLKRGFTNLSVSFGCTGGQHRSVYSAEKMAEHLHHKFGCRIYLSHIEQGISKTIESDRHE
ncbi:MAG: phosphotransferase [Muribaculum sp.]|nr:phosphotransferase [Muribaculum sp.]